MTSCTAAELWMITLMVWQSTDPRKRFFVVQLSMWADPYILVNYPYYKHVNSCRKRSYLAVAANRWHNWAITNLVDTALLLVDAWHLCVQTGNNGSLLLYCVHITKKISTASIQTLISLKLQLIQTSTMYQMKAQR